jgi:hypothetical protein
MSTDPFSLVRGSVGTTLHEGTKTLNSLDWPTSHHEWVTLSSWHIIYSFWRTNILYALRRACRLVSTYLFDWAYCDSVLSCSSMWCKSTRLEMPILQDVIWLIARCPRLMLQYHWLEVLKLRTPVRCCRTNIQLLCCNIVLLNTSNLLGDVRYVSSTSVKVCPLSWLFEDGPDDRIGFWQTRIVRTRVFSV